MSLKEQDARNARAGNPTRHFEVFTRGVRDLAPQISVRIDRFFKHEIAASPAIMSARDLSREAAIQAAFPEDTKVHQTDDGTLV